MSIFVFVVAIVAVIGANAQEQRCTPPQWEGTIGVSSHSFRGSYRAYAKTSYDATDKKTASTWISAVHPDAGEVKVVTIYKEEGGTRYFIRKDKCCKMSLKGEFKKFCVPADAKEVGSFYYGLGDNKLTCDVFRSTKESTTVVLAMTTDNIPTNYAVNKKGKWFKFMSYSAEAEFVNITAGIQDPAVFDVPASCGDGCGKQEAQMYLVQDNEPLLLYNPFDGEDLPGPSPLQPETFPERSDLSDARLKFRSLKNKLANFF